MEICFAILGDKHEVSGGHLYNREIANSCSEINLCYSDGLKAFKASLTAPHQVLIIDAWGLHEMPLSALKQKYFLLCHHPIALDTTISGDQKKELDFWNNAEGIIVTGSEVANFVRSKTKTPVLLIEPGITKRKREVIKIDDTFSILGVGSFIERKGDELLFNACTHVVSSYKLTRVGPVPDDNYLKKLNKMLKRLHLKSRIGILGQVSADELQNRMDQADLAVFPTSYESYGMAIQECLAHGIPVLASKSKGLKTRFGVKGVRYVENTVDAWAGELNKVLEDKQYFVQLKEEATLNELKFNSWEEQARKLVGFLSSINADNY